MPKSHRILIISDRKSASNGRLNTLKRPFEKDSGTGPGGRSMERGMWRDFSKLMRELWRLSSPDAGSYRPDLHYMRGPGPKWHAKYDALLSKTTASATAASPSLREIAERHA